MKHQKLRNGLLIFLAVLLIVSAGLLVMAKVLTYPPDSQAIEAMERNSEVNVEKEDTQNE